MTSGGGGDRKARRPDDDPGWAWYPETVVRFRRRGRAPFDLDLRQPIGAAARARLATVGLTGAFGVVTALAPGGTTLDVSVGRHRTARLARTLRRLGGVVVRADGGSPDGRHVERGWASPADRDTLVAVARGAEQSAIFHFDGAAMWIVPVLVAAEPIRLPVGAGAAPRA